MKKLLLLLTVFFCILFTTVSKAQISGTAFLDINGNGLKTATAPVEPGIAGITINVYDSANVLRGATTSAAAGTYSVTPTGTAPYRVEFVIPVSLVGYEESPGGANYSSSIQFVTTGTQTNVNFALVYNEYFSGTQDPRIAVPQHIPGDPLAGGTAGTANSLKSMMYSSTGTTLTNLQNNATASQIGATWGLAWDKYSKKLFSAAFVRRHSGLGPQGPGGIYVTNYASGTGVTTNLIDLDAIAGIDLGTVPTNAVRGLSASSTAFNIRDELVFGLVGKVGLGDIDIDFNQKKLYVVNLNERNIIVIDIANYLATGTLPTSAEVSELTITGMPTCTNGVARPFALKVYKDKLFIGITCTGENELASATAANMNMTVVSLDLVANTWAIPVPTTTLDYVHGEPQVGGGTTNHPWSDATDVNAARANGNGWVVATQPYGAGATDLAYFASRTSPWLTDIEFDVDGSMVLSTSDRGGFQWGGFQPHPNPATPLPNLIDFRTGGDILRFYNNSGTFVRESGGTTLGGGGCTASSPSEYYCGENYNGAAGHAENSGGALAFLPGSGEMTQTAMDPSTNIWTNGIQKMNNTTGAKSGTSFELYGGNIGAASFAKSGGLGDVELLLDVAPIQVGNRVWFDTNGDGIQTAGEPGISNIPVTLRSPGINNTYGDADDQTWVVNTNATGNYYFDSTSMVAPDNRKPANVVYMNRGLLRGFDYRLEIDTATIQYYVLTLSNEGSNDLIDNDAIMSGTKAVINFNTSSVNHSFDFGLSCEPSPSISAVYTKATCPGTGITPNNNASLQILTTGDKAAISTTGIPATTYAAATAVTAGSVTFINQNGTADTFYVRVFNGPLCTTDTIIAVTPARCCPTIAAVTTPATYTLYCSGTVIPNFNVLTNAIATDSIRLVYFTSQQTDPNEIYNNGGFLAQKVITGVATTVTNTANFTNIALPLSGSDVNDTLWIYAIYIDKTGDTTCKPYSEKAVILKPLPIANIDAFEFVCNATAVTLTSDVATSYKWGVLGSATIVSTAQAYTVTPPSNTTTTYWLVTTNAGACASDTAYHSVTASSGLLGTVFRDFNSNGIKDATERYGIPGVKVIAFLSTGVAVDSAITDANGRYVLSTLTPAMGKIRIEFIKSTLPAGFQESFAGTNNATDVQFVTVPACAVNWAVKQLGDYCQANPMVTSSMFVNGSVNSGQAASYASLAKWPYANTGAGTGMTSPATKAQIGSVWGLAYSRNTKLIYSSSVVKRHVGLKDNDNDGFADLGAIYVTNTATNTSSLFVTIPNAGVLVNDAGRNLGAVTSPNRDSSTVALAMKSGLGDVDISKDETKLYVTNLNDKKLYVIDIATASIINSYLLPQPCDISKGSSRPFALGVNSSDELFVGLICDGSVSNNKTDLSASVYRFDGTNFTQVFSAPLNYTKQAAHTAHPDKAGWYTWSDNYDVVSFFSAGFGQYFIHPQPVLSDIDFDASGNLILGFIDRTQFQSGFGNLSIHTANSPNTEAMGVNGGDILKAYPNNSGTYDLEPNPGTASFYNDNSMVAAHPESALGGLAYNYQKNEVILTAMDPRNVIHSGGSLTLSNTTGQRVNNFETFVNGSPAYFGKGAGMGDIEMLCDAAPLQIGNYVWLDLNGDGVQDSKEPGVPNALVSLWKAGTQIASLTTGPSGEYYFSSKSVLGAGWTGTGADTALLPNTAYEVRINKATVPNYSLTLANSTINRGNDQNDNDAATVGNYDVIPLTTGSVGSVNHTYDFGYKLPPDSVNFTTIVGACTPFGATSIAGVNVTVTFPNGTYYTNIVVQVGSSTDTIYRTNGMISPATVVLSVPANNASFDVHVYTIGDSVTTVKSATLTAPAPCTITPNTVCTGTPSGVLSGNVFRDFNNNGTKEATETFGIHSVIVKVYDFANNLVGQDTTDYLGNYYIAGLLNTATYRVQFSNWDSVYKPSAAVLSATAGLNKSSVQFVTLAAGCNTTNFGLNIPCEYCQTNPALYTSTYVNGDNNTTAPTQSIFKLNYDGTGISTPVTKSQVGSVWGLTYSNLNKKLYSAALLKRHAGLGSLGIGGIYVTDSTTGTPTAPWLDVATLTGGAGSLGTIQSNALRGLGLPTALSKDSVVYDMIGKVGLGGISLSKDQKTMYVTDVKNKNLLLIDVATKALLGSYPIPDPGCSYSTNRSLNYTAHSFAAVPELYTATDGKKWTSGYIWALNQPADLANATASVTNENNFTDGTTDAVVYSSAATVAVNDSIKYSLPAPNGNYNIKVHYISSTTQALTPQAQTIRAEGTALATENIWTLTGSTINKAVTVTYNNITVTDGAMDLYFRSTNGRAIVSGFELIPQFSYPAGSSRPFAAKYYNGKVYVGVVCDAQNTQDIADLKATVYAFDTATHTFTNVLSTPLDYQKGAQFNATYCTEMRQWRPWADQFPYGLACTYVGDVLNRDFTAHTTPLLSDISFDADGSMIIGFMDRTGHQIGNLNSMPFGNSTRVEYHMAGGEILRAYNINGVWQMETNAKEGIYSNKAATAGANNNQGIGGGEFYVGDNFTASHLETSSGGTAIVLGKNEVVITCMDPIAAETGGVKTMSNITGAQTSATGLYGVTTTPALFGKGNGMGDVEALCDVQPLELGNRVWLDDNHNGIQDAGEAGINGVVLKLFKGATQIATTTTSIDGNYYFNNANVPGGLKPDSTYIISIDTTGQSVLRKKLVTLYRDPSDTLIDNDGTFIGSLISTTAVGGEWGTADHSYDFGFYATARLGNRVWRDDNKDGLQTAGEPGVAGINVQLYKNGTDQIPNTADDVYTGSTVTDAYGYYIFENLDSTTTTTAALTAQTSYNVKFTLPANYIFTTPVNRGDNADNTNSDALPATGRTLGYILNVGESDTTVDAGIVFAQAITQNVGDRVWLDINQNGIQDPTENGVSGVTVTLYNSAGNPIATTITDASGKYLFQNVPVGTGYTVGFTPPAGMIFTGKDLGGDDTKDSDADPVTSSPTFGKTPAFNVTAGTDNLTLDAGIYPQATTTASLGDRVWNDLDKDGIQDAGEAGVEGVTVDLMDATGTTVLRTVKTDAFGNYMFNDLTPGTYVVRFGLPAGFSRSPINVGTDDALDSDAAIADGKTAPIVLAAGERNTTVDAGINKTTSTATTPKLGDRVWYDTNNDGLQTAGEPGVPGVTAVLYTSANVAVDTMTTNATGNYLFSDLAANTYYVIFKNLPVGYTFTKRVNSADNQNNTNSDSDSLGKTMNVALAAAETDLTIDAGIITGAPSGKGSLGDRVWYDINNNGIQDAGETGANNILVYLSKDVNRDGTFTAGATEQLWDTTYTNANGNYLFTGLDSGYYQVRFLIPTGYTSVAQNAGTDDALDSDGPVTAAAGTSVTATYTLAQGEDNLTVDLGLNKTSATNGSLGNQVWFDADGDGVKDAGETSMPGVQATLLNGTTGAVIANTTTDNNGYYLFDNLAAGNYIVQFTNYPAGMMPTTQTTLITNDKSAGDTLFGYTPLIVLPANTDRTDVDFGLINVRAALGDYVWIDANGNGVQEATEKPVPGVTTTLYAADSTTVLASMITNGEGKYYYPNLLAGNYVVGFTTIPDGLNFTQRVASADNQNNTNSDAGVAGKTMSVALASSEIDVTIDAGLYRPTASVGDFVWFDTNGDGKQTAGEPGVAGVIATLYNNLGQPVGSAVTDGNGYYLITNVPPGTGYYVVFTNIPPNNSFTTVGNTTDADNSKANPVTGATNTFSVADGQQITNIDAGLRKLVAALGNRVWRDDNKDGLQTTGEPGVAGISVTLYKNGTDQLPGTTDDVLVSTTVTDAYGKYMFNNLTPTDTTTATTTAQTSYNVKFALPANYVFTTQTGTADDNNDTNSDASVITGNTTVGYKLSPGEIDSTIDAGIVFPEPITQCLGDKIWLDINPTNGIQDAGEPGMAGVTVSLYFDANNDGDVNDAGENIPYLTAVTDADGKYQFCNIPTGNYAVGITTPAGFTNASLNQGGGNQTLGDPAENGTDSDIDPATGKTGIINLGAGEILTNVDGGLVPTPAATASLGDRVWNDLNQNGIQDAGETGVPGVTITLYDATGTTVLATTTTDAFGNYMFTNLPGGVSYVVGVTTPAGYTNSPKDQGTNNDTDSDGDTGTGKTDPVLVPVGGRIISVDFGIYLTAPAGTAKLGDIVWFDINKNGTQDVNEPGVAGVTATLYTNGVDGLPGTLDDVVVKSTATNATGYYQFTDLAAANYNVGFSNIPAGYSLTVSNSAGDNANNTNSDANPSTGRTPSYTLTVGESDQTVDAGLIAGVPSGKGTLGNKVWYDVTPNGIQDGNNETGVAGVTVTLQKDINNDGDFADAGEAAFATQTTNALGEYLFTGLDAGVYRVQFSTLPAGYQTSTQNTGANDEADSDGGIPSGGISTTGVYNLAQGEDNLSVDLGINKTSATNGSISDKVFFDTNTNGVREAGEPGIAGVTVTLYNATGGVLGVTTTDINGNYLFDNLPPANYYVGFSNYPAGLTPTNQNLTITNDNSAGDANTGITPVITLASGQNRTDVDFGLTSARASLGNYVWIDNNGDGVQDAGEPGVPGVTASLLFDANNDGDVADAGENIPVASMITNQNGEYLFTNLLPGNYQVVFSTIPTGLSYTQQNTPGDNNDNTNSDVTPATSASGIYNLIAGEADLTVDGGLFKPTASVGNYVWYDNNTINGIQDAAESGVGGVLVKLINVGLDNTAGTGDDSIVSATVTDGNGAYLFTNVPPANYFVQFSNIPGTLSFTTPDQGSDVTDSDANPADGTTPVFAVPQSSINLTLDAGIFGIPNPLPVTLQQFNAVRQGSKAFISWVVSNELNMDHYEVEHSVNGVTFNYLETRLANGSRNYNLYHNNPANGYNYYRLKMYSVGGAIHYSDVRKVYFESADMVTVYPIPAQKTVTVTLSSGLINKAATIILVAADGKQVYQQKIASLGQTEIINVSQLPGGKYILRIIADNKLINKEIEVIR